MLLLETVVLENSFVTKNGMEPRGLDKNQYKSLEPLLLYAKMNKRCKKILQRKGNHTVFKKNNITHVVTRW